MTLIKTDQDSTRLRVVDSAASVFNRLRPVLQDMGIRVHDANEEEAKYVVSGIQIKKLPTLLQRMGFKEYRGRIDELHLMTASTTETQVIAKTEFNVEVNTEGSKEFMTRLRFYLLTNYQQDETGTALASQSPGKWLTVDAGQQKIVLAENFDSTWVRVGRTLEASGVNIDDLDRSQGLYVVSFSSLDKKKKTRKQFRVLVSDNGTQTRIHVEGSGDDESDAEYAEQLLGIIYERLLT
ncbi:MAG: outer membrane protein assembly factor BamC [Alphaproteobacteria bacterium]|nr:outer membrane protein assembly factor BamC [Alphaproteobacteria bacterium]